MVVDECLPARKEGSKKDAERWLLSQPASAIPISIYFQSSIFNLQLLPTGFPGLQGLEEVITLVVHEDEGGEVLYLNLPHSLHTELRILYALDALDRAL